MFPTNNSPSTGCLLMLQSACARAPSIHICYILTSDLCQLHVANDKADTGRITTRPAPRHQLSTNGEVVQFAFLLHQPFQYYSLLRIPSARSLARHHCNIIDSTPAHNSHSCIIAPEMNFLFRTPLSIIQRFSCPRAAASEYRQPAKRRYACDNHNVWWLMHYRTTMAHLCFPSGNPEPTIVKYTSTEIRPWTRITSSADNAQTPRRRF